MLLVLLTACSTTPAAPPPSEPAPPTPVVTESSPPPAAPEPIPTGTFRRELEPGLVVAAYDPPVIPDEGFSRPDPGEVEKTDRRLIVVTIDPSELDVRYLSSRDPQLGATPATASEWAQHQDLHVAWNPGMFEPDGSGTGYTRGRTFENQPNVRRNALYRLFFVAVPREPVLRRVDVLDQVPPAGKGNYALFGELPETFTAELNRYDVVAQSLPILRGGKAAYPARKNQWSELAFGADEDGQVVVVFSRYPYEMREFGRRVEALGLGISGLVHGEGGPETTLVVRAGGVQWSWVGSYETGFAGDENDRQWTLPAVMGAVLRPDPP